MSPVRSVFCLFAVWSCLAHSQPPGTNAFAFPSGVGRAKTSGLAHPSPVPDHLNVVGVGGIATTTAIKAVPLEDTVMAIAQAAEVLKESDGSTASWLDLAKSVVSSLFPYGIGLGFTRWLFYEYLKAVPTFWKSVETKTPYKPEIAGALATVAPAVTALGTMPTTAVLEGRFKDQQINIQKQQLGLQYRQTDILMEQTSLQKEQTSIQLELRLDSILERKYQIESKKFLTKVDKERIAYLEGVASKLEKRLEKFDN